MVEWGQHRKESVLAYWGVQDDRNKQAEKLIRRWDKEHASQRDWLIQFPKLKACEDKVWAFAADWEHEGQEFDWGVSDAARN